MHSYRWKYSERGTGEMSIPIAPTPVLEGKNAKCFDRLVKQGLKKPVDFVPTPGIEAVKKEILKRKHYITVPAPAPDAIIGDWAPLSNSIEDVVKALRPTIDYKKAFEMVMRRLHLELGASHAVPVEMEILKQCTKGGA